MPARSAVLIRCVIYARQRSVQSSLLATRFVYNTVICSSQLISLAVSTFPHAWYPPAAIDTFECNAYGVYLNLALKFIISAIKRVGGSRVTYNEVETQKQNNNKQEKLQNS